MERKLHIVYSADNFFAEILGASLTSLYDNNKEMEEIYVYILERGLSDENKKKIETISNEYNRSEIKWIKAKDIGEELHIEVKNDRGSSNQYARLFVSSSLPDDLERVLYLDCDTIITQPLFELWNLEMHGKIIAALMDAFSRLYRKNINLQPNDIMFNSGVMLIDLNRWKEFRAEQKIMDFIKKKKGIIQQGDQGALNAVLSQNVYCFDPKFNSITIFYDFSYSEMQKYRKPPNYYPPEKVKEAVEHPVIIHYTTSFLSKRPWFNGCQHRYVNLWLNYKALTPWKSTPLLEFNEKIIRKIAVKIFNFLPRRIAIWIAGIFQAYFRPIKNKLFTK